MFYIMNMKEEDKDMAGSKWDLFKQIEEIPHEKYPLNKKLLKQTNRKLNHKKVVYWVCTFENIIKNVIY